MPEPLLRPAVLDARAKLADGRQKLRYQHDRGSPGIQVCACLADLLDTIVLDLYQAWLDEAGQRHVESLIALVPHGGYGRRDVAPYSDVDLMLLHAAGADEHVAPLARRLNESICDAGLSLGFSLRTAADACRRAQRDPKVFTSLAESRFLGGSDQLYQRFAARLRRDSLRRSPSLVPAIERARREEQHKYGETVYLLEPNVKRSRGALRDLHLVRWLGFARYGESDPDHLVRLGAINDRDHQKLRDARDFLLRLRNELHFHAGRSQDLLTRDEQLRLAERFHYAGEAPGLPVEQFMRDYFEHTSEIRHTSAHFANGLRRRSGFAATVGTLFSHRVEGDIRVGPIHISVTPRARRRFSGDLAQVLRLMDLANLYSKRIDHDTWESIRSRMIQLDEVALSDEAAARFLSLLSQPGAIGDLLRRLHQLRALEQVIPAFRHARSRVQFNEYHKYTVDEHSFRAVERATEFLNRPGPLGEAYVQIKQKRLLHLALLIHDLGKGHAEDHSDVGLRIAEETGRRLRLPLRETEMLKFLVHKHLLMANVAFWQDLNDESVPLKLAADVGSPYVLQMLYVLSCADLAAVGPGVLNDWKLELLTELYHRTRRHLTGDTPFPSVAERREELRSAVRAALGDRPKDDWWTRQIEGLPSGYLLADSTELIVEELERLGRLAPDDAAAWARYLPERKAVAYTVGAHEEITPGIFHRLTGTLSSKGLHILSAEIHTLADNLVLDRFYVHDGDFSGPPPHGRLDDVCAALVKSLKDPTGSPPTFRRLWKAETQAAGTFAPKPTQVRFDNTTSERFTIVTVFAYDRMGLLYEITRTLFELGLSVRVAKIATYVDQVADVFYVVDADGRKIASDARLAEIRSALDRRLQEDE